MNDVGYIVAGYVAVFGGLAGYALRLAWRGRALSRRLPEEDRRWT